jgi:hypothetical protein
MLLGHQASPGGKLATMLEYSHIADRRNEGRRRDWANPWDGQQTLTLRMRRVVARASSFS